MFLTADDFNLIPYAIPNLSLVSNSFQDYVDDCERVTLKKLLGVELYYEFIEALENMPDEWDATITYGIGTRVVYGYDIWESNADSVGEIPAVGGAWTLIEEDNKWLMLRDGGTFTWRETCCQGDYATEWLGVADMLKPYVFYSWLRDTWDNHSGIGVVVSNAENAEKIAPARRLVDAYTAFSEKANVMLSFIQSEAYLDPAVYNCCSCWPGVFPGSMNTFNL